MVYRFFKTYLRFLHDKVYYKKTYTINNEIIPADGNPLLIVSNHQNCLNDPLGILFSFRDRKANFITRADVFAMSPLANKFLRAIGLLPAFRLDYEGEKALQQNEGTFKASEEALINGKTVIMFPEAGHQDKRWLGNFSFGYTKLAFEAAEIGGFEKDVQILPSCNHYSDYFGMQRQFLVKFGQPISLMPYYELYKTKPRTAQRTVNALVRKQIEELMLNITDLDNYEAIDYIRLTYGKKFAKENNCNPSHLPSRLLSDKNLVARLDEAKAGNAEEVEQIYKRMLTVKSGCKRMGITHRQLGEKPSVASLILRILMLVVLLPLWITSLWPSLLCYLVPMGIFWKKVKDPMFEGTFLYALNALFLIPLMSIITIICYLGTCWWVGLIHVALFPALMLFAWYYKEWSMETLRDVISLNKKKEVALLRKMKDAAYEKLDKILTRKQ